MNALNLDLDTMKKELLALQQAKQKPAKERALSELAVLDATQSLASFIGYVTLLAEKHPFVKEQLGAISVQEALGSTAAPSPTKPKAPRASKPPITRSSPGTTDVAAQAILDVLKASKVPMAKADVVKAVMSANASITASSCNTAWLQVRPKLQSVGTGPATLYSQKT